MAVLQIDEIGVRSVLTPQDGERSLSLFDYSLNPYQGCGMGCSYCYVIRYPFAEQALAPWGDWVKPKTNAPFLLGKARQKVWGKRVFMSSATDPYQYVERTYRLSRRCLRILLDCNLARMTVHTRSHLVLDDLDLLKAFGDRLEVGFSIPTDDDSERSRLEPKAPTIEGRLRTMRRLGDAGIRVRAAVSPLLRCDPARFAGLLAETVDRAWVDTVRYQDQTYLRESRPDVCFFGSRAYREMAGELEDRLTAAGLVRRREPKGNLVRRG